MWIALDIFIGLTLCYALVSLFCSVVQEFIAQALDSRGKLLVEALKDASLQTVITKAEANLVPNPGWLIRVPWLTKWGSFGPSAAWRKKLSQWVDSFTGGRRLPHDISAANLATALIDGGSLVASGQVNANFETVVKDLDLPAGLKSRLLGLSATARANVDEVKQEIEKWFADFIAQVQHWYVRRAQAASLIIGFLVALCLNIDTIHIAKTLYHEPAKRDAVVKLAVQVDKQGQGVICPDAASAKSVKECLDAIETSYPFRVGWDYAKDDSIAKASLWRKPFAMLAFIVSELKKDPAKLFGILLTALALSLGARFWFDLLKNLVALRTGGQPDKPKKKDQ